MSKISLSLLLFSLLYLFLSAFSYLVWFKDPIQCQMSYMHPSFTPIQLFTRFNQKYALYSYADLSIPTTKQQGIPVLFIHGNKGSYKQVRSIATETARQTNIIPLDFYTIDFNEELSGFHGASFLEQAEFVNDAIRHITELYGNNSSVVLLAHSMGGAVARTLFRLNNYRNGSVATIITFAAPHAYPPAPVEYNLYKAYDSTNSFWRQEFRKNENGALKNVFLVSIAGGNLDSMVPSELSDVSSIVPNSNGFTVYSSEIPGVWTCSDHQAILWCNQLVRKIAEVLNGLVDGNQSGFIEDLGKRMNIMTRAFKSGFKENTLELEKKPLLEEILLNLDGRIITNVDGFVRLKETEAKFAYRLELRKTDTHFVAFTSLAPSQFLVVVCSQTRCLHIYNANLRVNGNAGKDWNYFSVDLREIWVETKENVIWILPLIDSFVFLHFGLQSIQHSNIDFNVWDLFRSREIYIPNSIASSIRLTQIDNDVIALKATLLEERCAKNRHFPSLLRQVTSPGESKWWPSFNQTYLTFFGVYYSPEHPKARLLSSDTRNYGMTLQFWHDGQCESQKIQLQIDILATMGQIARKSISMLVAFPFFVLLVILRRQIKHWNTRGSFPSLRSTLLSMYTTSLVRFIAVLSAASVIKCIVLSNREIVTLFNVNTISEATFLNVLHNLFSQNADLRFSLLLPLLFIVSVGFLLLLDAAFETLITVAVWIVKFIRYLLRFKCSRTNGQGKHSTILRKSISMILLLALVYTVVPYEFAYMVAFLVHIVSSIRSRLDSSSQNLRNYQHIFLLLFLLQIPFTLSPLIVWTKNLSVYWHGSTDHSLWPALPFVVFSTFTARSMLPRMSM